MVKVRFWVSLLVATRDLIFSTAVDYSKITDFIVAYPGPNLGGGRPEAHLAWWVIWWVTGLAHIKDYGIQSARILAVKHYYVYYQYDYSFLTVN